AFLLSSEMCPQRRPRNKKRPSRMAKTVHISGEMRRLSKGSAQVFTSAGWRVAQLSPVGTPAVCGKAPDYWLTRHDDTSRARPRQWRDRAQGRAIPGRAAGRACGG